MPVKPAGSPPKKTVKTQKNLVHAPKVEVPKDVHMWKSDEPEMPNYFGREEMKEWKRVIAALKAKGEIEMLDRAVLEIYCTTYANYIEAEAELKKSGGQQYEKKDEYDFIRLITNPWAAVRDKHALQLRQLASELGFNPVSRAKMKTSAPEKGGKSAASNYFN